MMMMTIDYGYVHTPDTFNGGNSSRIWYNPVLHHYSTTIHLPTYVTEKVMKFLRENAENNPSGPAQQHTGHEVKNQNGGHGGRGRGRGGQGRGSGGTKKLP